MRNVGSADFDDVALKQAIDGGWIPGPRIVPATYCDRRDRRPLRRQRPSALLRQEGGRRSISGAEDAREKVRWVHKYGAEVIKICATGGVFSLGDTVGAQQLSLEEMKAIADEAHMLGLKVAAHAHGDAGIHDAILAGIDTIEHASLASDATIQLAKQHGTWFDMDIYNDDYILATGTSNGTEQESLDKERMVGLKQRQTFQRAVKAGREDDLRHRRRRLSARRERAAVRQDGAMGNDPAAGDPGRDLQRLRGARTAAMSASSRPAAMATSSRSRAIRCATSRCSSMSMR